MVNHDGNLLEDGTQFLDHSNRGLRYGDALFETMRCLSGRLVFWEDHYLRLMSSMRILRMEIPMSFTMEFLEGQVQKTLEANALQNKAARIRLTVFRQAGGRYLPATREVSWVLEAEPLDSPFYLAGELPYEIELYKDFYVNDDLLSTLKTNNKILQVTGSIYCSENGYANCLLLNQRKMVVEALNANVFLVQGNKIRTPPLSDGCLNGIIRKKILEIVRKLEGYTIEESSISPFDLQKADELFITNSIIGIRSVTRYRKAIYTREVAKDLLGKLNAQARLG
jgi:branched-chain amino acid aminotransferase